MPAAGGRCHQDWIPVTFHKARVNADAPRRAPSGAAPAPTRSGISAHQLEQSDETSHQHVSKDLKKAIKDARTARGWTQKQLAAEMGCAEVLIREYESGKAIPVNAFVARMEKVLGCKLPRAPKAPR